MARATTTSKKALQVANQAAETNMLAIISKAASDPKTDVAKMQSLLDMHERLQTKQAEIAFNSSMARLQKVLPRITKKGMIEFTDKKNQARATPFARYEDIDAAIRPLYIKEGFSISFDSKYGTDGLTITATISHELGHSRSCEMRLPLDSSGSKNTLQATGSSLSYGKRYTVCMLLNIITTDEDDDGESALPKPKTMMDAVMEDDDDVIEGNYVSSIPSDPSAVAPGKFEAVLGGTNRQFDTPAHAADYVFAAMEKRASQASRQQIASSNTHLIEALMNAGDEGRVNRFSELVKEGK